MAAHGLWQPADPPKTPKRVVWDKCKKDWLARQVAKVFKRNGVDVVGLPPERWEADALLPLNEAVNQLMPEFRRFIKSIAEVRTWLIPTVIEITKASRGQSDAYPANWLDEPKPVAAPVEIDPEPIIESVAEEVIDVGSYAVPDGYCLVGKEDWDRIRRDSRRTKHMVRRLSEQVQFLTEVLYRAVPSLAPPDMRSKVLSGSDLLMVTLVGIPRHDQPRVIKDVGDLAEIVFVNPADFDPQNLGESDHCILMRATGGRWIEKARDLHPGRTSVVASIEKVIEEVRRLVAPAKS